MRRFDKGQASSTTNQGTGPTQGSSNLFPYGQCTWWANERYHELHGIYVPWTTQSDAWRNLATDGGSPDFLMRDECMELAEREEERIH